MGFSCGCVGLPNVGKSTLFNVLLKKAVAEASNYAFCTIEPNKGHVAVLDSRLEILSKIEGSKKIIYPTLECVDIAGLVKGASEGEGLGNKFLGHIRQVDLIMHVVRCFENKDITHVEGRINPVFDVELVETELIFADSEILDRWVNKKGKGVKHSAKELELAKKALDLLNNGVYLSNSGKFNEEEVDELKKMGIITILPKFYVANMSEDDFKNGNEYLDSLKKAYPSDIIIPICVKLEAECLELNDEEQKEMYDEYGLKENGLNLVLKTGYNMLNLHTYFTIGPKEARGWAISKDALAPEAAGAIHTDFEKGFISADVISYDDFVECNGHAEARNKGKLRQEGKKYIVQDGDVCNFKFNV
ncbi:redox-regulated ATPase YchF [Candidatus Cytomitobacter indipagum]|uniref:Ribosome-binding ATPase YchF n=1 Tax=Candidatus Cytomitobacter indipagum TaxID=2601575 RepID=A0A5C0UE47_9PROT|nr:redox-regulated ATPase YchF [Candidatus Cytomitobacter indipagum]QEK37980.1 redox-regulated ATPase YchF [Candidatus Cytomitobacter indipagum]